MSLVRHIEAAAKGVGKKSKGPSLSKRAWSELADALGIPEERRGRAESAMRLFLETRETDDDGND